MDFAHAMLHERASIIMCAFIERHICLEGYRGAGEVSVRRCGDSY